MKKVCKVENIDCANCALKIEEKVNKLNGVKKATLNFFTEKLILECEDSVDFDTLSKEIKRVGKTVERDFNIV